MEETSVLDKKRGFGRLYFLGMQCMHIVFVAIHFDAEEGDPNYDLYADLNEDGVINILDIILIAIHFGEEW